MRPRLEKTLLRARIRRALRVWGYDFRITQFKKTSLSSKDAIRRVYAPVRKVRQDLEKEFVRQRAVGLMQHFACGKDIDPTRITVGIEEVVSKTWQADLFRLATLLWSVPVSRGFGRRMRFLVWDRSIDKLIGVFALTDPVFNLSDRDNWIGWSSKDRELRLQNVMDAYVVGAVPPYSALIGGKLVAAVMASEEVSRIFSSKYKNRRGIISKRRHDGRLLLITTTSALGRSSLYNRLRIDTHLEFQKIGETHGWGHFHFQDRLFSDMRRYLSMCRHGYANGHQFGNGPSWRLRVIRMVLKKIGLDQDFLLHGIKREIFGVPLLEDFREYLCGRTKKVTGKPLTLSEISDYCLVRWIIPRGQRDNTYLGITREDILKKLTQNGSVIS